MTRHVVARYLFGLLSMLIFSDHVAAQSWTDQLFDSRSHDFGFVARGKLKKTFIITNKLSERVHVMRATPSCSVCTVAKPEKDWLEPGESTTLDAELDAHKFQRRKEVAIDVEFDQPRYGRTRLLLVADARTDIVLSPGAFAFGTVRRGNPATVTIKVDYAGNPNWTISAATISNPAFEPPVLEEVQRGGSRVTYLLKLNLKDDASPGPISDRVILAINDAYNNTIDVQVEAFVAADVSVSPAALNIGPIALDASVTKQVMVKGVRDFKIMSVDATDGPFQIDVPEGSKRLHMLAVKLKPGQPAGEVTQQFTIATDMEGEKPLKLTVSGRIVDSPPAGTTSN